MLGRAFPATHRTGAGLSTPSRKIALMHIGHMQLSFGSRKLTTMLLRLKQ